MTTDTTPNAAADGDADGLTDAWLDAAFAATREARLRRAPRGDGPRSKALVLTGGDIAQLRWMLRLRAPASPCDPVAAWTIELRNTRSRVATLRVHASRLLEADGASPAWAELRDGETLARWLSARGFRAPFEAWKHDRGGVISPRARG